MRDPGAETGEQRPSRRPEEPTMIAVACTPSFRRVLVAAVAVSGVLLAASPLQARVASCRLADRPAATLLFPYFEVDLDGSRTTLIAINNVGIARPAPLPWQTSPELVRVTLWTDWGVPTMSFNVFLRAFDVQTLNLRDLLQTARAPITGPGAAA